LTKAEISLNFYKSMDMSVSACHQQLMINLINGCHCDDFKEWNKLCVNRIVSFEVANHPV